MELRIFTEPQQGATYDDLLAVARRTEHCGFAAFYRSDHYLAMGAAAEAGGLPGPTDAWTTLAGLARETSTIRLGTLVTAATFRHPGPLAVTVAQVDQMSGGRADLGIGAGWFEQEHDAYAIPFPPLGERFERLGEQLAIITGLWGTPIGERFSFAGEHYTVTDSPALPKPVNPDGIPVLVGGRGARRTPALAARYATEFNVPFPTLDELPGRYEVVREAMRRIGRDPATMAWSAALVLCCGRDETQVAERAGRIGREVGELRTNGLAGSPAELVDTLGRYAEAGVQRMYLQVLDLADLDHLDLVASEVLPQVR